MNNFKKIVSHFLVLGILATAGGFSIASRSQTLRSANAESVQAPVRQKEYTAADFAGEVEADGEELGVSINQSNVTDTSQSLTFTFRSKTLVGFCTARRNYIVQIDDANFTGDVDNPASDDYEILDEETGLPIFNGFVSFVTGAAGANSDVYLPSTLTKEGGFIIKVTKVSANAVTADGAQYSGKNKWDKITNIYLPSTIETVEAGAFTGLGAITDKDIKIHVEASSLPAGYAADWTDARADQLDVSRNSYNKKVYKEANTSGKVDDLTDEKGRPINFVLGCQQNSKLVGEQYDRPLVIQYDKVTMENGVEKSRETIYEELPLTNTVGNPYDSCGPMSSLSYSRLLGYKLAKNETIDDNTIYFHNLMIADKYSTIDTSKTYYVKAAIGYGEKQHIENLLTYKASLNSKFMGYSMFGLSMDKNLSITSAKYPEPHSLYLDVKTEMYEQNKLRIESGQTKIRYNLYNLYNSSYHIQYIGGDGELKDIVVPIKTVVYNQELTQTKDNKVSILLKNSDIAPDFAPEKVKLFELQDITIQMDLLATSDSGSVSVLGKSSISYKFAYITVIDAESTSVFNWDLFLILFFVGYVIVYAIAAYVVYRVMKEKFKNDEFRRVNDKKFLKTSILGGLGLGEVLAALLFIIMRTTFFKNTIVVFNPTDPLLIGFSIVGMIIVGYFIVYVIKLVKTEKERRKIIRLKLNEDVEDDGTN